MRMPIMPSALCALLVLCGGSLHADRKPEKFERKSPLVLYERYEALNTPENLGLVFVGGQPPRFIEEQTRILLVLGGQNKPGSSATLLRVADEYLERVAKLGPARFRTSPLQALQLPMVSVLAARVDQLAPRTRLEKLAHSPLIKEYARARAVVALVGRSLVVFDSAHDEDGSKRGKMVLDGVLEDLSFEQCTHSPARLIGVARLARKIVGNKPGFVWEALPAGDSLPKRYARDFAFTSTCSMLVKAKKKITPTDMISLVEICERWLKEYRPLLAKQKFPSDLVGRSLRFLAAREGNAELARLMPPEDPKPVKPRRVEP